MGIHSTFLSALCISNFFFHFLLRLTFSFFCEFCENEMKCAMPFLLLHSGQWEKFRLPMAMERMVCHMHGSISYIRVYKSMIYTVFGWNEVFFCDVFFIFVSSTLPLLFAASLSFLFFHYSTTSESYFCDSAIAYLAILVYSYGVDFHSKNAWQFPMTHFSFPTWCEWRWTKYTHKHRHTQIIHECSIYAHTNTLAPSACRCFDLYLLTSITWIPGIFPHVHVFSHIYRNNNNTYNINHIQFRYPHR